MLINALCKYYDFLSKQKDSKLPKKGYSDVEVRFLVELSDDGKIVAIHDMRIEEELEGKKDKDGNPKIIKVPKHEIFPRRSEKSGMDVNFPEHRPRYLFGLRYDNGVLTMNKDKKDTKGSLKESHEFFREGTLAFFDGTDSETVAAYCAFARNWNPEKEKENPILLQHCQNVGNECNSDGYAFCRQGRLDQLLHQDRELIGRWEKEYQMQHSKMDGCIMAQCAVEGIEAPIPEVHGKIKGIRGGNQSGARIISYKNPAEQSYGYKKSHNSNISVDAMEKYTAVLNYLLREKEHHSYFADITLVYWAMDDKEKLPDCIVSPFGRRSRNIETAKQTDRIVASLMKEAKEGKIRKERLKEITGVDPDVDFYITGFKPSGSRISVKLFYHRTYGQLLQNIAEHQNDIQIEGVSKTVSIGQICRQLRSPKSAKEKNEDKKADASMYAKIMQSVMYGTPYPNALLVQIINRVKMDSHTSVKIGNDDTEKGAADITGWVLAVRAGIIKACLNREARSKNQKEELLVALDESYKNQAYICGRLFAVLEGLQQIASKDKEMIGKEDEKKYGLNHTVKDAFFTAAMTKPYAVFPRMMTLAEKHLKKLRNSDYLQNYYNYYSKMIGKLFDLINKEFPDSLSLKEQGRFIVGYQQQRQAFFRKKDDEKQDREEVN